MTMIFVSLCYTSVKIIKNEEGCRDDTVPKTVETRRHCKVDCEDATIFRNPLPTSLHPSSFLHLFRSFFSVMYRALVMVQ